MKRSFSQAIILCLVLIYGLYPGFMHAETGISLGTGRGVRGIVPYRAGVQVPFEQSWRCDKAWPVTGFTEISYYYLQGVRKLEGIPGLSPYSNNHLSAMALGFALRMGRGESMCCVWPYLEVGVGGALLDKKEIAGRALGMHFEFEDRVGAGFRFGAYKQFDLCYRFIHFSNACLASENNGINLHFLIVGYWF